MATPAAVLSLLVTTEGTRAAAAQLRTLESAASKTSKAADSSAAALRRSGGAANKASSDFSLMAASARRSEQSVQKLGRSITRIGTAGGIAGALGLAKVVKDGIAFNATMEQNKIAFTQFLGSAKAANKELRELYKIAKTTPFEFSDVTLASRKLMAMGFTVKETNKELRILADAASGAALSADGINRMVLALGQMKSKGVLQMEDLRQLQELGIIKFDQLAKDLGLTAKEMQNIGKVGVPAAAAIQAINRQLQGTFGGQSQKQAQTFTGQLSTLKDNYKQFAGSLTSSTFDFSKTIFGKLNKALTEINDQFRAHPKLSLAAKIEIAKDKLVPVAREIASTIGDQLQKAHLGDKIVKALDAAIPVVAKNAGKLGLALAKSFAKAFVEGDPLTQLALGAFFVSKFVGWGNVFRKLGGTAGKRFSAQFALTSAAGINADLAANGAIGTAAASRSKWGKLGRLAGGFFGTAAAVVIGTDISQAVEDALHGSGPNKGGRQSVTSGGQWDLSEWIANAFGINQGKPGQVGNGIGGAIGAIGKSMNTAGQRSMVNAAAKQYGIPPALLWGIYGVETGYGKNVKTSSMGAKGAFQFMQGTAPGYDYPYTNKQTPGIFSQQALGAAHYISDLLKQKGGNVAAALRAYSGGGYSSVPGFKGSSAKPGKIKWKPIGGAGGMPSEIADIVKSKGVNQTVAALAYAVQELFGASPGVGKYGHPKYTKSGNISDHFYGNAIDIPAEGKENIRIAHWLQKNFGSAIKQLIYSGNDSAATGYHGDHVHLAIKNQPGLMNRILQLGGAGLPFSGKFPGPAQVKVPALKQSDFMAFIQGRIDHFDLMVQAGLMSAAKATLEKRRAIKDLLPNLRGDTKLQALVMLRGLKIPTAADKTWTPEAKQRLAMAVIRANPGNVANLPAGVLKAAGPAATMENPWLQAFTQNLTNRVGAGLMTQAEADAALKPVLEKTLPFLTGQDAADVRSKLFEIATNTKDTARAALDTANSVRAGGISDAGFLGGLTGPAATAVLDALSPYGIVSLPGGGNLLTEIGNPQAASELAKADIGTLMAEVNSGQVSFADVWPQIRDDLSVIAAATGDTGDAVNAATEAVQALTDEMKKNREHGDAILRSNWNTAVTALADVISGQIAGHSGYQGRAATAGAGSTYRL